MTKITGTLVAGVTSPQTVTGLLNGTTYYFVVSALNSVGLGVESAESSQAMAAPIATTGSITASGDTSVVTVDWAPVLGATTYNLYWGTTPGVTRSTGQLEPGVNPPFVHAGLANGVTHYYVVCSLNAVGGGAESIESAEASATPLAAPTGLSAAGETQRVNLDWNVVPGATSYTVYWATTSGVNRLSGAAIPGVSRPYVHGSLLDGTTYYYVVTAVSSVGGGSEGAESTEVFATPLSVPTGGTAVPDDFQVTITWNTVPSATSYSIYWANAPGVTKVTGTQIPGLASPYVHTSLTNGLAYYYVVTGVNATGESDESPEMLAMPIAAPMGTTATPGDSQVTLAWNPCAGATSYNLYWSNLPGVTQGTGALIPGVTSPYVHPSLINGDSYYYVVTALNPSGESEDSAEVLGIPIAPPPGVLAAAGDTQVTLSWSPVIGATSYNIYFANATGVTKGTGTPIAGVTSPHDHLGLANGTSYYYVVTAIISGSEGEESTEVAAMPIAPITGVSAAGGTSSITLDWNLSAGASTYNVYWDTNPGVTVGSNPIPGVTPPHTHTGRTNGQAWYYVVTGENAVGDGVETPESAEVFAQPVATPLGVTAVVGNLENLIRWRTPVVGAQTYNIYWSTSAGVTKGTGTRISGVTNPYLHSGRTDGVPYYYVVTAENTVGSGAESAESVEASATPYNPTGTPDATFNGQGWVVDATGTTTRGYGITTDASGRILVAGEVNWPDARRWDLIIWRYNADGTINWGQAPISSGDATWTFKSLGHPADLAVGWRRRATPGLRTSSGFSA